MQDKTRNNARHGSGTILFMLILIHAASEGSTCVCSAAYAGHHWRPFVVCFGHFHLLTRTTHHSISSFHTHSFGPEPAPTRHPTHSCGLSGCCSQLLADRTLVSLLPGSLSEYNHGYCLLSSVVCSFNLFHDFSRLLSSLISFSAQPKQSTHASYIGRPASGIRPIRRAAI